MEMDFSEEYVKMDMDCESRKSLRRGRPCSRQTGILVLLGTICMIIFMIMTSVIYSNQERKFSELESWMNSHTSHLSSVKSDFQITGRDLEKKFVELQNELSGLSSYLNTSGSSNQITDEKQERKLSKIETLMSNLSSSLSSLALIQEENQQNLGRRQEASYTEVKRVMDSLSVSVSEIRSTLTTSSPTLLTLILRTKADMSKSLMDLKQSVGELSSSVSFSYKLLYTTLITADCTEPDWIPFRNSCYLFSTDMMNWTAAKDYCQEQNSLLLKLEDGSEKEWQFVINFAKPHEYWIGLTDQNTGQWRWTDDTPYTMNQAKWRPGQPDDWKGHGRGEEGEDCGHITVEGLLNDLHCSSKKKFICEMTNKG